MTLLEALARFIEAQRECQGELSIEYGDLLDAYIDFTQIEVVPSYAEEALKGRADPGEDWEKWSPERKFRETLEWEGLPGASGWIADLVYKLGADVQKIARGQ